MQYSSLQTTTQDLKCLVTNNIRWYTVFFPTNNNPRLKVPCYKQHPMTSSIPLYKQHPQTYRALLQTTPHHMHCSSQTTSHEIQNASLQTHSMLCIYQIRREARTLFVIFYFHAEERMSCQALVVNQDLILRINTKKEWACVCMYSWACICMHSWTRVCMYLWTCVCIYLWTRVCMYLCNTYMHVFVSMYIYIYVCMYIYIYTYAYSPRHSETSLNCPGAQSTLIYTWRSYPPIRGV